MCIVANRVPIDVPSRKMSAKEKKDCFVVAVHICRGDRGRASYIYIYNVQAMRGGGGERGKSEKERGPSPRDYSRVKPLKAAGSPLLRNEERKGSRLLAPIGSQAVRSLGVYVYI